MTHTLLKILTFSLLLVSYTSAWSVDVKSILAREKAPEGIVFEIVSGKSGLLGNLLSDIKTDINRLRERFPELPIAIVTHGSEQFDLLSENRNNETKAHSLVESLVRSDNIDVHVCGTHAEWRGKTPEDFPAYVDVSATGPAQINDYENLGYEVITLP